MTLIFHPRIQNDLLEIIDYYDAIINATRRTDYEEDGVEPSI